jgi:hypothetical protein
MAVEARDLYPQGDEPSKTGLDQAGVIIEFPRTFTDEEKLQIRQENLTYIQELSIEQDPETVEKAQRDMKKNPNKRLVDLYFNNPNKRTPNLGNLSQPETDPFGKPIFRHPETRYIP